MEVILKVMEGPELNKMITIKKADCLLFGRTRECPIDLSEDPFVSRNHFLLEISPPDCKVTDIGSKNGIFVNGVRYGGTNKPKPGMKVAPNNEKETTLKDRDEITIGGTVLKVFIEDGKTRLARDTENAAGTAKGPQSHSIREEHSKIASALSMIKPFEIEKMIGKGGMGVVYKAIDKKSKRAVALKSILPLKTVDVDYVKIFHREIELIRQLNHKYIVKFLGHGKIRDIIFLILEYVDGISLREFLRLCGGRVNLPIASQIMLKILEGMAYAHQTEFKSKIVDGSYRKFRGIVHRDLSPQNILLYRTKAGWVPKISDFGFAKSYESAGLSNITMPGQVAGTPIYWPREQITHYKYLDPATDVFSLAAIYYELLTGSWVRDGFQEMFKSCLIRKRTPGIADFLKVISLKPTIPVRIRCPEVPEPVADVIDKALRETEVPADDPNIGDTIGKLRYKNAGEFYQELISALKVSNLNVSDLSQDPELGGTPKAPNIENDSWILANDYFHITVLPESVKKKVALIVVDVVRSTVFVAKYGDTVFCNLIYRINNLFRKHDTSKCLLFLKSTGDGFFAAYESVLSALKVANEILKRENYLDLRFRIAIHHGEATKGPGGDLFGKEVHRVFRMEGVKQSDCVDNNTERGQLPEFNRIIMSKEALSQIGAKNQSKFKSAGNFHLKGFDNPFPIWVAHSK